MGPQPRCTDETVIRVIDFDWGKGAVLARYLDDRRYPASVCLYTQISCWVGHYGGPFAQKLICPRIRDWVSDTSQSQNPE